MFHARFLLALAVAGCGIQTTPTDLEDAEDQDQALSCEPEPACDAQLPDLGEPLGFLHTSSTLTAAAASANHRGHDLLLLEGEPQWVLAKFAYGLADKDIKDEDVDVFVLRGCGQSWEWLGEAYTTDDDDHATTLGVKDTGGRIFFRIPEERALEPGRHRVHIAVRGDLSGTDLFIRVVDRQTPIFVSDVDGTLTTSEYVEFQKLLTGGLPKANAGAPAALWSLAKRGYLPIYVTARPEWLTQRTRDFLSTRGFPPGLVRTSQSLTGAVGASAASYKQATLGELADHGAEIAYAFGNTATDGDAYDTAGVEHQYYFRFDDDGGGQRIESYNDIAAELDAAQDVCGDD